MLEIVGNIWNPDTWHFFDDSWRFEDSPEPADIAEYPPTWAALPQFTAVWICVTTNGDIRKDGRAVMGAGIAREVRDRFPGVDKILAQKLQSRGNRVSYLCDVPEFGIKARLLSFPTKNHWQDDSSLELIESSAKELAAQFRRAAEYYLQVGERSPIVILPRPGCSNGRLDWKLVKGRIGPILAESNFWIISKD